MFSYYVKANVGSHHLFDQSSGVEISNRKPICTGDHVWVGMGAALLPGCDVGSGSVVGAAALVNQPIPAHSTCAGNPARVRRTQIRWER